MMKKIVVVALALIFVSVSTPTVAHAKPAKQKSLKQKSFKQTMKANASRFQRCFDEERVRSKGRTKGRVNLRVTLDQTGKVVETSATKNTTKSALLAECLMESVRRIGFGKQKKKRSVHIHAFRVSP